MKRILAYVLLILTITAFMGAITLTAQQSKPAETIPSPTIYQEAGVEIIDKRFTEPDCYEILRRTKFENGLTIDQWHEVSKDEYEQTEVINE